MWGVVNYKGREHTAITNPSNQQLGWDPRYLSVGVLSSNANAYLARGANLSGVVDGQKGILSCWLNFSGGDGTLFRLAQNGNSGAATFRFLRLTTNFVSVRGSSNIAGADVLLMNSSATVTSASSWVHVLAAWDLTALTGNIYLTNVVNLQAGATFTNSTIQYAGTGNFGVGAASSGENAMTGNMADFYLNLTNYVNIALSSNRQLFIDQTSLKPSDLGPTGAAPTGTQPAVYLRGPSSAWPINLGNGGDFTASGTFSTSVTSPSQ